MTAIGLIQRCPFPVCGELVLIKNGVGESLLREDEKTVARGSAMSAGEMLQR